LGRTPVSKSPEFQFKDYRAQLMLQQLLKSVELRGSIREAGLKEERIMTRRSAL